jgi:hypothetical protein
LPLRQSGREQRDLAWFRLEDGLIIEHWANRDDLGLVRQLGWIPPSPGYLLRMARAKRQERRRPQQ